MLGGAGGKGDKPTSIGTVSPRMDKRGKKLNLLMTCVVVTLATGKPRIKRLDLRKTKSDS